MILEGRPEMVIGLPLDRTAVKNTLYCIRVMGQAISELSKGASLLNIGVPDPGFVEKNHIRPVFSDNWIEGQIIFIDQQPQMAFGVQSIDRQVLKNNVVGLAKAAKTVPFATIGAPPTHCPPDHNRLPKLAS